MFRIEFVGKTKAKVISFKAEAPKHGQKDLGNAVTVRIGIKAPNASLDMLDKKVRSFIYEKGNIKQNQLDEIEVVSDLPSITSAAMMLGALSWDGEQTGCKLTIHQGITGDQTLHLKDGTVSKIKTTPREGGTVEWELNFYSTDADKDTYGALGMLIKREVDIELEAGEVFEAQKKIKGEEETPESALAKATNKKK